MFLGLTLIALAVGVIILICDVFARSKTEIYGAHVVVNDVFLISFFSCSLSEECFG